MMTIFEQFKEERARMNIDIPSQPFRHAFMEMTTETNKMENTIAEYKRRTYYTFGGKPYINQFREIMKELFNHANGVKKLVKDHYVGSDGGVAASGGGVAASGGGVAASGGGVAASGGGVAAGGGGVAASGGGGSGGGARGHPLQISNLPVPDGSGTNFYYTGNASGYPLIINNKLGVSIFGKEVVDMDGFNDGRKIILTQRETTKADSEGDSAGDSSASSQKGFMDMNLNHRAVSDISEDPSSDDEDDFQEPSEDFIGSYFF
jgi:hypothetical protein